MPLQFNVSCVEYAAVVRGHGVANNRSCRSRGTQEAPCARRRRRDSPMTRRSSFQSRGVEARGSEHTAGIQLVWEPSSPLRRDGSWEVQGSRQGSRSRWSGLGSCGLADAEPSYVLVRSHPTTRDDFPCPNRGLDRRDGPDRKDSLTPTQRTDLPSIKSDFDTKEDTDDTPDR